MNSKKQPSSELSKKQKIEVSPYETFKQDQISDHSLRFQDTAQSQISIKSGTQYQVLEFCNEWRDKKVALNQKFAKLSIPQQNQFLGDLQITSGRCSYFKLAIQKYFIDYLIEELTKISIKTKNKQKQKIKNAQKKGWLSRTYDRVYGGLKVDAIIGITLIGVLPYIVKGVDSIQSLINVQKYANYVVPVAFTLYIVIFLLTNCFICCCKSQTKIHNQDILSENQ